MRAFVLAAAAVCGLCSSEARCSYIVNFTQVGANVVATGSGTLNLVGLTFAGTATAGSGIIASQGVLGIGPTILNADYYQGAVAGPANFGSGTAVGPTTTSGLFTGIEAAPLNYVAVPHNYVIGSLLAGTDVFNNASFASLGLTAGQYTYSWTSDSFVINIPTVSRVPEPASLALLLTGALGIAATRRRRGR